MKSEYYQDIEKKDLFKQGYIGNSFHRTFFTFQAFEGTERFAMAHVRILFCFENFGRKDDS